MIQELASMTDLARRMLRSGTPGTLSTLFAARGSTYRPVGSMMVALPGKRAGGVSGGCLEEYVARVGEQATRSAPAALLHFSTHPNSDDDGPVLGCGGSIDILVERLAADHLRFLEELTDASESDEETWLACAIHRRDDTMSVRREWLSSNRARLTWPDPDVLIHSIPPITRLLIFGAGDDGQPLCELAASLGWHVSVADRRARFATQARFPRARAVVAGEWDEAADSLRFSPRTAVVLMTHNLDDDARVLARLSGRPFAYLGALGPAHRREWLLEQASSLGGCLDERIPRMLRGPVGLDLGERSGPGIAVAIVAEILAHLNAKSARSFYTYVAA